MAWSPEPLHRGPRHGDSQGSQEGPPHGSHRHVHCRGGPRADLPIIFTDTTRAVYGVLLWLCLATLGRLPRPAGPAPTPQADASLCRATGPVSRSSTTSPHSSGGEVALIRLVEALGDRVDAHVILAEDGPLGPALEAAGATVHVLPMVASLRETRKESVRPGALGLAALTQTTSYLRALRRLCAISLRTSSTPTP